MHISLHGYEILYHLYKRNNGPKSGSPKKMDDKFHQIKIKVVPGPSLHTAVAASMIQRKPTASSLRPVYTVRIF